MGDKIEGLVWCSQGILFASCCDGGLWPGEVECVPSYYILGTLEVINNHNQELQL